MNKRIYNISFDLHTVSGIVISVALFVIFFAGTFSFFRDEIINWERNEPVTETVKLNVDVDAVLDTIAKIHDIYGRDITLRRSNDERNISVVLHESKTGSKSEEHEYFYLDTKTFKTYSYEESYTLGEFLYRLHFFAQIPYPVGYFLSGLVALFFLFAIVTGIIVHWEKLVMNFYLFRPWAKLKTVWTDAHTVLGTIGLPFQLVYAVTGAYFMIRVFLLIPTVLVLYGGDTAKIYDELGVGEDHYAFVDKALSQKALINPLIDRTSKEWHDFVITQVNIYNYQDSSMVVDVDGELDRSVRFTGNGEVTYRASTGEVMGTKDPYTSTTYVEGVLNSLTRLHYGDYGGYALKVVYFILGLISCFVILSGVLLWLEARRKPHIPEKKTKFNELVGYIYLAICLTMYPVTAFCFIVTKLIPANMAAERGDIISWTYAGLWLLLTIVFTMVRNNHLTNKFSVVSGMILGLLIPFVSGVTTGLWFWTALANGYYDHVIVDVMWISLSAVSLYAWMRIRRNEKQPSAGTLELRQERKIPVEVGMEED